MLTKHQGLQRKQGVQVFMIRYEIKVQKKA